MQNSDQSRIYRLKTILLSLLVAGTGIGLLFFAKFVETTNQFLWLRSWPLFELGSTLFITGLLVIAWDYMDGRDREVREDARLRRLLAESAPEFRDAVVRGFAVQPDDLKRVATPELLDQIATNVLGLRLGDAQFAAEIYADVRDQAIRAPERWYDVEVSIRLSTAVGRGSGGTPLFDVLVEWEYTTTPSHPVQKFACVSDRREFDELVSDVPATSTWFMTPRPGFDASQRGAFELLYFSVDGQERSIRRAARKTGQTYAATIGSDVVQAGNPVRVKHIYRTITPKSGHKLFMELAQPSRGISLELDYTQTDIAHVSVSDLVSSANRPVVSTLPKEVDARVLSIDLPGWVLPRAGFTFVWTLTDETSAVPQPTKRPVQSN